MAYTERSETPIEISGDFSTFDELSQLFEQESEAIVAGDMEGNLTYCNPAFSRLTGYDRESVVGTIPPFPWWSPEFPWETPEGNQLAMDLYKTVMLRLVRAAGVFAHPKVIHPKEGVELTAQVTIRSLASKSGAELGVVLEIRPAPNPTVAGSPEWDRVRRLTPRELEVFDHLRHGRRPSAIAKQLDISDHTARSHVKSIYKKLDIHSRQSFLDRF